MYFVFGCSFFSYFLVPLCIFHFMACHYSFVDSDFSTFWPLLLLCIIGPLVLCTFCHISLLILGPSQCILCLFPGPKFKHLFSFNIIYFVFSSSVYWLPGPSSTHFLALPIFYFWRSFHYSSLLCHFSTFWPVIMQTWPSSFVHSGLIFFWLQLLATIDVLIYCIFVPLRSNFQSIILAHFAWF